MKGVLHDDDRRVLDVAIVPVQAGQLDGGLVGLSAGIADEGAGHAGYLRQPAGELFLQRYVVEVRCVYQLAGLSAHRVRHGRVSMAERIDADSRYHVEVALAATVDQPGALAVAEADVQALVGIHQGRGHGRLIPKQKRQLLLPMQSW